MSSLSDCPKCWSTPCECGYGYRNMTKQARVELAAKILGVAPQQLEAIEVPADHPMHKGEGSRYRV